MGNGKYEHAAMLLHLSKRLCSLSLHLAFLHSLIHGDSVEAEHQCFSRKDVGLGRVTFSQRLAGSGSLRPYRRLPENRKEGVCVSVLLVTSMYVLMSLSMHVVK